jgi:pimeloyl-ACP methyl ester carboxylesterase
MTDIHYRTVKVDGRAVFYREAGAKAAPKLLLLHGFPTAGHMFRDLIPGSCRPIPYRRPRSARLRQLGHAG